VTLQWAVTFHFQGHWITPLALISANGDQVRQRGRLQGLQVPPETASLTFPTASLTVELPPAPHALNLRQAQQYRSSARENPALKPSP
jgi:hypothetical protein